MVGQLLGLDGDREGHIVDEVHASKGVGGALVVLFIADVDVHVGAGVADLDHRRAILEQQLKDVVLGGDGAAIAPHQAVVDGHGVGLGAVLVLGLLVGGDDGLVVGELALLGVGDGVAAVDQVIHGVVGRRVRESSVVELVDDLGGRADDQLAGGLSGAGAGFLSGSLLRGRRFRGGSRRIRRSVVGDRLLAAAGRQRDRHGPRQQQGRDLGCVLVLHVWSKTSLFFHDRTPARQDVMVFRAPGKPKRACPFAPAIHTRCSRTAHKHIQPIVQLYRFVTPLSMFAHISRGVFGSFLKDTRDFWRNRQSPCRGLSALQRQLSPAPLMRCPSGRSRPASGWRPRRRCAGSPVRRG